MVDGDKGDDISRVLFAAKKIPGYLLCWLVVWCKLHSLQFERIISAMRTLRHPLF